MHSIAPENNRIPKHLEEARWVTDLIIDLKLQLVGEPPFQPITMERLNQWSDHVRDGLDNCTEYIGIMR